MDISLLDILRSTININFEAILSPLLYNEEPPLSKEACLKKVKEIEDDLSSFKKLIEESVWI